MLTLTLIGIMPSEYWPVIALCPVLSVITKYLQCVGYRQTNNPRLYGPPAQYSKQSGGHHDTGPQKLQSETKPSGIINETLHDRLGHYYTMLCEDLSPASRVVGDFLIVTCLPHPTEDRKICRRVRYSNYKIL